MNRRCASLIAFTHIPPHSIVPVAQTHVPARHIRSLLHALPHVPQSLLFESTSAQPEPQSISPGLHTHAPAVQISPVPQTVPQSPQCIGSFWKSTHRIAHTP